MTDHPEHWSRRYEITAVILLSAGFALVGLDRWIIAPLLPVMMKELNLTYQDTGNIVGILALSWGVCSTLVGRLSDGIGRRRVLIPALLLFSLMSGFTGMVGSLGMLLLVRALMGAMEGAYLPACTAATAEASADQRRGLNQGIQLCMFALVGLGFGPLIANSLLQTTGSWRSVFFLVAIPGLVVAGLMYFVIREPAHLAHNAQTREPVHWGELLRARNVLLGMACILCAMSCVFVLAAMLPSYLTDFLKLDATQVAAVLSAIGLGGGIGQFLLNGLSDFIGRRLTTVLCFVGALLFLWLFSRAGTNLQQLFWYLALCSGFSFGILSMATGPIATEAVPPTLTASAIGVVSGTGEIFGGGVAPALAGWVAQHHGIQSVLNVAMIGLLVGIVASLALRETAPRRTGLIAPYRNLHSG